MFERFTDRARRVAVLADREAKRLQHNYIGTEHLLLGLIAEGEGIAAQALAACGVDLEAARGQIEAIIGRGTMEPPEHIAWTPRARKVLDLCLREALQLGHTYIGTEHILLGLMREGEGVAWGVLTEQQVDLAVLRAKVIELLGGPSATKPVPPPRWKVYLSTSLNPASYIAAADVQIEGEFLRVTLTEDEEVAVMLIPSWRVQSAERRALGAS